MAEYCRTPVGGRDRRNAARQILRAAVVARNVVIRSDPRSARAAHPILGHTGGNWPY